MIPRIRSIAPLVLALLLLSCSTTQRVSPPYPAPRTSPPVPAPGTRSPRLTFSLPGPLPAWVDTTLAKMSVEEKAGQVIMARAFGHFINTATEEYDRLAHLVVRDHVGGIAVFQGDVYETAVLLNRLQGLARIPLLVGADFERGLPMRIRRGTPFPDAMAMAATRNPDYASRAARAIAREARAIGVHQNFAPVADVNNNPDNPVINTRSFGEDLNLTTTMVTAFVRGLNDGGVVSTVKHFPGHGDTGIDSHVDLPTLNFTRARLDSVELAPFRSAVNDGVMSVMIAHLEVPAIDSTPGLPASLSPRVIGTLLRGDMGFRGLVITDAMEMKGLVKAFSAGEAAVRALQAGVDIVLMPTDERTAIQAIARAVRQGEIPRSRIDEAVTRILMIKQWLLLDEHTQTDLERIAESVGTPADAMLARTIARDAITLVKNDSTVLPLQRYGGRRIVSVIVSDTEDNRTEVNRPGYQWPNEPFGAYFSTQLRRRYGAVETYRVTPASTSMTFDSILTRTASADIILLPLYVRVRTSSGRIGVPESFQPLLGKLAEQNKPVVVIAFGNPYTLASVPFARAALCAYGDSEPLVEAAAEAIFGEIDVRGRLPVSIPGLYPFGTGLTLLPTGLRVDDPAAAGFRQNGLEAVDSLLTAAIRDSAFPAAQIAILRNGVLAMNAAYGSATYARSSREIDVSTLFDLASLTKVVATTPAIMRLYDQGVLRLTDSVARFLPAFSKGPKAGITIRHLLTHTAGFPPYRKLWEIAGSPGAALDSALATPLIAAPGDTMIYSDLGMVALGKVVEVITAMGLDAYVRQEFYEPLKMLNTTFRPSRALRSEIAPTELDTVWRKVLVQGTVHDENAAALGGVSGHAGLFSTASDLAIFMQMMMNGGTYGGRRYLADSTVRLFTRAQAGAGTRALGWDTRSPSGSSAGSLFSPASYGHTGFTGTSLWADPERGLVVVFLTNRIHPYRANTAITKIRPALHDAVVRAL